MVSVKVVVGFVVVVVAVITILFPVAFHFSRSKGQDSSSNTTTTRGTNGGASTSTIRGSTNAGRNTTIPTATPTSRLVSTSTPTTLPTIPPNATMTLTNYTAALTSSSPMLCTGLDCSIVSYFYHAILLNVSVSGNYTMKCFSNMDTFGYLYQDDFEPLSPTLYMLQTDYANTGDYNYTISSILLPGGIYILVTVPSNTNVTGSFRITIWGVAPVRISVYNSVYTYPIVTVYRSALNRTSHRFNPFDPSGPQVFYYQAFLISVSVPGHYFITSNSSMETCALLYTGSFDPSDILQNQLGVDWYTGGNLQFGFAVLIDTSSSYILVATTSYANVTGSLTIVASGQGAVVFNPI